MVSMAVGADRVIENHSAVGPALAVPLLHEVIINFALNMSGVTAFAERHDLGPAEELVGGRDVEFIVAVGERIAVTIGTADTCLFVLG